MCLFLSFHLYTEEWPLSCKDIDFICTLTSHLWISSDWNFMVFGVFEDGIKTIGGWMDLAAGFCNIHWALKSVLRALANWLHFQKCRSQPFCYLIRKCSDQNLWTCIFMCLNQFPVDLNTSSVEHISASISAFYCIS